MSITFHCAVMTPNGLGIVQGREVDAHGNRGRIIVSHDPALPGLPESLKPMKPDIWVLAFYEADQLEEVTVSIGPKNARSTRNSAAGMPKARRPSSA